MVSMLNICEEVERFTETATLTAEQHVDMRASQIERDTADAEKLKTWFNTHPPFPVTDRLVSIHSGIVGGPDINCHLAQELGVEGVKQIVDKTFATVTFKRKDKVKTLASVTTSVKVLNRKVNVDPLTIFQRVCITKQSDEQLKQHFAYELAPYPLSLFTEEGMRKGTKSSFYSAFTPLAENIIPGNKAFTVVDGGYLLHKVVWHRNHSVRDIVAGYVSYVLNNFGKNVAVVFDGYPEDAAMKNTKSAERLRRSASLSCGDILFDEATLIKVPQAKKAGLKCSILCSFCQGRSCSNVAPIILDEEDEELDDLTYEDPPPSSENVLPPPPSPPPPSSTDPEWMRPGPSWRAK